MSTLSGIVSKGEKGKPKYQSLDINSLYRVSRGESLEPHQQKNTLPRKHGMQSLGKVPSARRPPANLPSLKSETSSSDPAVSLVPSGGSGWATTKDSTSSTTTTTTTVATSLDNTTTVSSTAQCAAGTTVSTSLHSLLPTQQNVAQAPFLDQANRSSWSAIMSRSGDVVGYAGLVGGAKGGRGALGLSFLAHQSPQFQHEFPSLSGQPSASVSTQSQTQQSSTTSNAISVAVHHSLLQQQPYSHNHSGGPPGNQQQSNRELNAQYGPGPSLRPQTEGSWIQGGSRTASGAVPVTSAGPGNGNTPAGQGLPLNIPVSGGHTQEGPGGGRQNLGQSPNMGAAPAGQHNAVNNQGSAPSSGTHQIGPNLHPYRGLIPPFMYRSNFPPQFQPNSGPNSPRPRFNHPSDRFPPPQRGERMPEEEILTRPIIKEEDLTRMDDISRDAGWAAHDDIDYNQKLAFSDDEGEPESSKNNEKTDAKEKRSDDHLAEEKEKPRDNRDSKELRDPPHRPWAQSMTRDYRGSNGAGGGYAGQSQLHSVHSLRGVEDDETWNERRRIKVEVASVVERARLRKEEEEKRFQESTKQAAAKKLQDLEQKMKEKQAKHKDEERAQSGEPKSLISIPHVPLPIPEWEREKENRERESRERERTSSEGKDEKIISSGRETRDNPREGRDQGLADFRQNDRQNFLRQQDTVRNERERERDRDRDQRDLRDREQPAFSRHFQNNLPPRFQKQQAERSGANFNRISPNAERPASQSVPFSQQYDPGRWLHNYNSLNSGMKQPMPSQRRNRTDSDASAPLDDERPPSRDHRGGAPPSREDRYRHSSHRPYDSRKPGSYYDEYGRNFRDYEYDDRHPRDSWERERHFDDKERDPKENLDSRDNRDSRDIRDSRDTRDNRDGRDVKDSRPTSRDARDVRDVRDKDKKDYDNYSKDSFDDRERSENPEWREERNVGQDRQLESRRDAPKEERSERPQRPDSRDSRASRESKTSLRDDELHKLRDCSSWVNEMSDYEGKKRDLYHEETRERERDRRQPPGPVTKEKLEADELKNEKRSLTQLKRGSSDLQDKKEQPKEISIETKKDTDVWNRKTERAPESRQIERSDNSPKAWADAISPTFEKEEEKMAEAAKDGKENDEIKQSLLDKPALEKREETGVTEDAKEQVKDEKREKSTRNKSSSSSSSRIRESRGGRQWGGTFSVYTRGWRGPESRGRRGGPRPTGKSGMSVKSGSYGHTDSENSADEISGSTESGKEDKRSARSPKPSQKVEKEERNREVSRREDKRGTEYSQTRSEKRTYDGKPSHEAFAPSGEPSRRGRGGFRIRNTATGSRMEGYGPPSSKSPFSSERNTDEKHSQQQNTGRQNPPTPTSEKEASLLQSAPLESSDDKMIAKQQALTAGITGRRNKSPSQQAQQSGNKQEANHANQVANIPSQKVQMRKEESRSKRTRSGSRRGRDNREARSRGSSGNVSKQPQSDVGNEDWETTSENSEEHIDDHKESRNNRNKHFSGRAMQSAGLNAIGSNMHSRRGEQLTNTREQREKNPKSSNPSSRAPGAEKRNLQNSGFSAQKSHTDGIPPLMQNAQIQNGGRSRSQSSTNSGAVASKLNNKDSMVNRIDEIKLSDPNLVNQALNDLSKKSQAKDKKLVDSEVEANSCAEDATSVATEDKVDADGFQEVRSKKNVKESRHNQKEEAKPIKREKEKERERDRSKSKSNGSQQVLQQVQNIPPLLSQNIPQPANIPQKQYDSRNSRNPRLAPRFQRLVKQQQQQQQQQMCGTDAGDMKLNSSGNNYAKESSNSPAPPPTVNAWDKPFTSQLRSNSPSAVPTDIQLMSLTAQNDHSHEGNEANSGHSSQRNSPSGEKAGKNLKETLTEKNVADVSSPPVQTLIFENTNYSKTTKTSGPTDLAVKSKFSNHIKTQQRAEKRLEIEEEGKQVQQHQQPALSVAFSNKPNDLIKDKNQEPIQMPLSFNKNEDNADMKLDFTFDSDLSQLTDDKSKSLSMARSMHMAGGQSTISPSTAELNLKIASVKKVWENAPPMPTVVEHEDGTSVVSSATSFPQAFESGDVDDSYSPHQQYNQSNIKSEITTSTNVCKLVPPQVKPQQQTSGSSGTQPGSTVPGPSSIGAGQSPIGHPPVSLQGPLSPPPFNSTAQPSHINYQEFPQYPGSQAAQYGGMSAIPSPPAVLFNTGSGQLPAQAGGLYGAFQLDQSRSPFTQYAPYAPSLQSSFSQQNVYLQQPPPPPPHAPNAPTPEMYQNNLSQYRITAAAAPPFGQNQQLSNNPNTVLISSSSNSLMSASVKPSSQPIGAIGTKAPHFQTPSAPQPNQLTYIPYDPNQVLGVSGSYMSNSQLVQRPGPNVQASNSYYSATSADVFPGSQTGFYQSGGATQQTGTHYGLQGFGQHSQSLATGSATPVGLQNYGPSFLSSSGLQIAAAAQQFRNPTGGLPGPGNAAPTFLSKHQPQEQPRQLKSPSGNQQDVLASVFSSTPQIPSPKSRNCKQQSSSQQPQPSPTQHHKYQQYQGVSQSALVLQQNVRGMGMPPRAGIQPSQQRYPPPIQRPAVPFAPGPNPNNLTQQQPACMPQQQQQAQINRHRPNLHQQQQQRNMKMQQQYYSAQGNVKMDSNDKSDNHNDKMNDGPSGTQPGSNKSNVNQQDSDNNKEEVNQQNE